MRHIQSSQSRAPQKKKMIVEQSRNHPNLFIITSASLPTNISTIFKGPFKKTEFKHVLYEFSFSHKIERSQKFKFFLEEPPPCPMPFQQVAFNLMLKKVVKPCPTWAVSLLVLFFYMTVRVNFFLKFIF